MKKIEIIQSLVEIANVFDQNRLAKSANTLTKIAQAVADQDDIFKNLVNSYASNFGCNFLSHNISHEGNIGFLFVFIDIII
jgi:hypothetical protein